MSVWVPRAIAASLGVLLAVEALVVFPEPTLLLLIAIPALYAAAGVVLVSRVLPTEAGRRAAWLIGPALGIAFSAFALFLLWSAGLQGWVALLLAPVFTLAMASIGQRCGGLALRLPTLGPRDRTAVLAVLLVVPVVTLAPYDHVRERVEDGEAYRAYFTADFVWAMSVTAEISKGDVPPANPFLAGAPLRYYWLSHLLSGAVYRNVAGWGVDKEPIVLINGLAFGLAFAAFFYWLARSVGASPGWAAAAVMAGFVANSYEGADMIRAIVTQNDSWERLRDTNIDAVTRWFYRGMAVDGLQRLLLYQPHHLTGYVLALSALWLVGLAERVEDTSVALWAGILLGLAFLFSTFAAVIMGPALALAYGVRLIQQRALKWTLHCIILGGAPLLVGVAIARTLGYSDPDAGLVLQVGLNLVAFENWRWVIFSSFGPLLLFGVPALLRPWWTLGSGIAPVALILSAFAFYFATDVPDMGGVWVGWRSGHMLLIAFSTATAVLMTAVWRHRRLRLPVGAAFVVAVAFGVPTVAIDVYNAQDTTNRGQGAGFPWTLVITDSEREALDWIRTSTERSAVVQPEPFARDPATWAYVPAFAERRMAAGLPISMIPLRAYQEASEVVRAGIFRAESPEAAHAIARGLNIDYVLIGAPERRAYGGLADRLLSRGDLFSAAFSNDAITVLRVHGSADDAARLR